MYTAKNVQVATVKGTVSPAERCDFVSVKLEKVHELFQVCRICGKEVVFTAICIQAQTANIFTRLFTLYNMTFAV